MTTALDECDANNGADLAPPKTTKAGKRQASTSKKGALPIAELIPPADIQDHGDQDGDGWDDDPETMEYGEDVDPASLPIKTLPSDYPNGLLAHRHLHREKILVQMVGKKIVPAAMIMSEPGLGKTTHTVTHLYELGLRPERDFVLTTGHSTPMALFAALYRHRDKILVLDDCDSALRNRTALNILKGALDNKFVRKISYLTMRKKADLPLQFTYTGGCIFLTNFRFRNDDMDGAAIKSRCLYHDLALTPNEKLDFIEKIILPQDFKTTTLEDRKNVFELVKDAVSAGAVDFNFRIFTQLLDFFIADRPNIEIHLRELISGSSDMVLMMELKKKHKRVDDAVKEFMDVTGKSKRQFYYLKNRMKDIFGQ